MAPQFPPHPDSACSHSLAPDSALDTKAESEHNAPITFLTLPTEIRLKVYSFVFDEIQATEPLPHVGFCHDPIYRITPQDPFGILRVCKQIQHEAARPAAESYHVHVISGWAGVASYCSRFPPKVWPRLHWITLTNAHDWLPNLLPYALGNGSYPGLRVIQIRANWPCTPARMELRDQETLNLLAQKVPENLASLRCRYAIDLTTDDKVSTGQDVVKDDGSVEHALRQRYSNRFDVIQGHLASQELVVEFGFGITDESYEIPRSREDDDEMVRRWTSSIIAEGVLRWDKNGLTWICFRDWRPYYETQKQQQKLEKLSKPCPESAEDSAGQKRDKVPVVSVKQLLGFK
ncbi:hypothetical protein H2200_003082 [Cladophialophora chaetospira]|uniref:F-box domain-containing protein n=1 Tax=Cladophialophora chaetospira TaxID=386627 RepID=A0AA38XHE0_9EURO|nr:hypothetical protein H2200_003082 [Cladophialophora chaetospira]